MPYEAMLAVVSAKTGYKPRTIERAMSAVAEYDFATHDKAGLREHYNLKL